LFTRGTVSLQDNDQLKMQFKKVGAAWEASEVRIVLPTNLMPYSYGTYKFSVKSVSTINTATGSQISSTFSPDLVLGMFTWDTTDRWDVHENWNHEGEKSPFVVLLVFTPCVLFPCRLAPRARKRIDQNQLSNFDFFLSFEQWILN
jgi:hypothetical protein